MIFQCSSNSGFELYALTAPGGNLTSRVVELNGELLAGINADLKPVRVDTPSLPPFSYGFIIDRYSNPPACHTAPTKTPKSPIKTTRAEDADIDKYVKVDHLDVHGDSAACLDPIDFGAITGDPGNSPGPNWRTNTEAIQAALDAAVSKRGKMHSPSSEVLHFRS